MAMEKILVINIGSASKKYALYNKFKKAGNLLLAKAHFEFEGNGYIVNLLIRDKEKKELISKNDYELSIKYFINFLKVQKLITNLKEISKIGIRIVAPGIYFINDRIIDRNYLKELKKIEKQAPLHIKPTIEEIKKVMKIFKNVKIIGVSDSNFHKDMPEKAKIYGLSSEIASKFNIFRYGYHGIAAQSALRKLSKLVGNIFSKIIICHLGSGVSVHAIKNGKSFDTSMGFTPLEGLIMASRVGNIDAGAVIYLVKKIGIKNLENYFNNGCGLLGISKKTGDIRKLLELESTRDKYAKLALETFVYWIKKYIGSYIACLGGLDLLVFTGTIGERSSIMRSRICNGLQNLGIILDKNKNKNIFSKDGFINYKNSKSKIAVIVINEMEEIFLRIVKNFS